MSLLLSILVEVVFLPLETVYGTEIDLKLFKLIIFRIIYRDLVSFFDIVKPYPLFAEH